MRFKNRYLLLSVEMGRQGNSTAGLSQRELQDAINESIAANFGEFGAGTVMNALSIRSYDPAARLAVLRCSRDSYTMVRACCTFVTGGGRQQKFKLDVLNVASSARTCAPAALDEFQERYKDEEKADEKLEARRKELEHL
jgi:RNase P/RNase MRP subunit POP5